MTVHGIIDFIISHNEILIESLVALIVLLVIFLAYRGLMTEKASLSISTTQTSELEEALKKVLERANQINPVTPDGAAAKGQSEELAATIDELKASLEERQKEIESLKSAAPTSASGGTVGTSTLSQQEKDDLSKKIAELEGKLAEYEIISEDIADLSFYKEENVKLKKELDKLKVAPAPTPAAEPTIVGTSKVSETVVNDDIMKEFAAAVESRGEGPAVDLEKVVSEAANLQEVSGPVENPLEKELDPEKLAAEADSLENAVKPDDAQLMSDFQNFIKKDNA